MSGISILLGMNVVMLNFQQDAIGRTKNKAGV
jgi:hypothetical protein